ncbi:hypothetical protein [Halovivax limisalsi]|uniref:hypothetical protein n=1 Tax=Halovivax limisalsi TaxID=1453760 RepID=UPI001FFDB506|nr:hypothetical protein [Halovivax limisalsi]
MGDRPRAVYRCSDGRYRTRWQIDRRLAAGTWRRCLESSTSATLLVERPDGLLLSLSPVPTASLPSWIELRSDGRGVWIADRRRTTPVDRQVPRRRTTVDTPNV